MIKKLRRNFVITAISIVSLVLIVVMSLLFFSTYEQLKNTMYDDLKRADRLFHNENNIPNNLPNGFVPFRYRNIPVAVIELDENNNLKEVYGNFTIDSEVAETVVDKVMLSDEKEGLLHAESIIYVVKEGDTASRITISDFTYEYIYLTQFALNLLLVLILTILVFLLISILLARRVTKPVENAWNQQKQFLSDASHELKTPLTVVLANTSILLKKKEMTKEEANKWIGLINDEAIRMKDMVDDLFFLAKSDENKLETVMNDNNISDIITESVLKFEPIAFDNNITFNSNVQENIFLVSDAGLIKQLIMILLDNAFKYCGNKGSVDVNLNKNEKDIELTVYNSGNYIPKEDIEYIFDRFYMVDKARVRNSSSHGLGLAIAREIVNKHNGDITASSVPNVGTAFKIVIPSITSHG